MRVGIEREARLGMPEAFADYLEQLERHGPDEPTVRLSLTDDVFLRSSTWARWQLGIPLPPADEREALRPCWLRVCRARLLSDEDRDDHIPDRGERGEVARAGGDEGVTLAEVSSLLEDPKVARPAHHHGILRPLGQPGGPETGDQRRLARLDLGIGDDSGGDHIDRILGGHRPGHLDQLHDVIAARERRGLGDADLDLAQRAAAPGRERLREPDARGEARAGLGRWRAGVGRLERALARAGRPGGKGREQPTES